MATTDLAVSTRRVGELARQCEVAYPGDARAASEALYDRLKADPVLFAAVADPFVRSECWNLIGSVKRKARTAVWNAPNHEQAQVDAPDGVRHLSNANRTLMDGFPLPNGIRLGDARREDLVEASEFYGRQARDMGHKASFLAAVAGRLKGKKRVRDALKEADLVALRDGAIGAEAA